MCAVVHRSNILRRPTPAKEARTINHAARFTKVQLGGGGGGGGIIILQVIILISCTYYRYIHTCSLPNTEVPKDTGVVRSL